jgi:hypothetical protein
MRHMRHMGHGQIGEEEGLGGRFAFTHLLGSSKHAAFGVCYQGG